MTSEERSGLTRRAVLRGAAAAGAASLVRPTGALAALSATPAGVFSRWVGSVSGESATIAAPAQFALVGVEWSGPARVQIELRTRRTGGGAWGPWAIASVLGHGPDRTLESGRATDPRRATEPAGLFGEPIWSGPTDYVQLRSSQAVRGVRLHFVAVRPLPPSARAAQAMPLAQPILDAGPGQPQIIARSAWAHGHARPSHVPVYGTVKLAFIHHSAGTNGYSAGEVPSILQSIFDYHVYVRGFWDIAYNFAVDAYGRIWEARAGGVDLPVVEHTPAATTRSRPGWSCSVRSPTSCPRRRRSARSSVRSPGSSRSTASRRSVASPSRSRRMTRSTRRSRPAPTCRFRGSPAIATATRRTAPATPSTPGFRRSGHRRPRWRASRRAPRSRRRRRRSTRAPQWSCRVA